MKNLKETICDLTCSRDSLRKGGRRERNLNPILYNENQLGKSIENQSKTNQKPIENQLCPPPPLGPLLMRGEFGEINWGFESNFDWFLSSAPSLPRSLPSFPRSLPSLPSLPLSLSPSLPLSLSPIAPSLPVEQRSRGGDAFRYALRIEPMQ